MSASFKNKLRHMAYKLPYYLEIRYKLSSFIEKTTVVEKDYIEIKCKDVSFPLRVSENVRKFLYIPGFKARLNKLTQEYLLKSIEFKENDIIIDCGANIGEIGMHFRNQNLPVRYYGFEPSTREFECNQFNNPNQTITNKGLWNKTEVLKFFLKSGDADSSFIEINDYDSVVEVPVVKLDELQIGDGSEVIKFMKVEAEGAEPEVIEGAQETLKRVQYVAVDVGAERGKDQEMTIVPVLNALMNQGFKLIEFGQPRYVVLLENTKLSQ